MGLERINSKSPVEKAIEDNKFPMPNADSPCGVYATNKGITYLFEKTIDGELIAAWRNLLTILENHSDVDLNFFGPVTHPIDWHIIFSNEIREFTPVAHSRLSSGRKSEISSKSCATINAVFAALPKKIQEKLLPKK